MYGKERRLSKLFNQDSGNIIVVPMDHGITLGPIKGLDKIDNTVGKLIKSNVDAILLHKGLINHYSKEEATKKVGLVMHLSGSTTYNPDSGYKAVTGNVYEAVAMGCDAVSVHINIGDKYESKMFNDIGKIASDCYKYGMPLLAMMYARGEKVINEYDVEVVKHAARVGAELGADIVKVNYTGTVDSFKSVVEGCPVPVVIAGGDKVKSDECFLKKVSEALEAGARGVSIGRNVFQSDNMEQLTKAIHHIVNLKMPVEKVIEEYQLAVNHDYCNKIYDEVAASSK